MSFARRKASTTKGEARLGRGDAIRAVRLLSRFTEGRHRTFVLSLGWLVIAAGTAVFEAYPLAYLVDYLKGDKGALAFPGLATGRASTVAVLTVAVVLIALVNSGAESLAQIQLARGGRALGYQLRVQLFGHLQRLSLPFHDRRHTGDVVTRVTGDVKEVEKFVGSSLADLAGSVLLLVATLVFLLWNSWQVALVAALVVPVLAAISTYFSRRIKAAARRQRAREGDIATATQEMLTSIRVVQSFGRARHDDERFAVKSGKAMDASLEGARLDAWFQLVVGVLEALSIASVIWIGLWLVDHDLITLGILVLFVILVGRMFKPTRRIIKQWNTVARVYASVERIAELLAHEVTVKDEPGAVPAPPLQGQVEYREVSFSYELERDGSRAGAQEKRRPPALSGVSFTIAPGEVVALVGRSGAGKTTIAQLVPRLYDPTKGAVLLDGHDVRGFTLESLRAQVSMVLQDTVLFRATVAENIAYGRVNATREQIVAAAVRANAHEFIAELPDGYDTELGEQASNLSGGQRQRIAIARAFIRDTPLLILDEPTTGLDVESTELVLGALRSLITEKTTLIISHDLSLIRRADRILVMQHGEIVEWGTHEALLEQEGLYAQLQATQFSDREDHVPEAPTGPAGVASSNWDVARNGSRAERSVSVHRPKPPRFDPLLSPALRRELPELQVALDGDAMSERLREALLTGADGDWTIDSCTAGKALYIPGRDCKLRYELEIRRNGDIRRVIVGARLFSDVETRDTYVRKRLEPLAAVTFGREEFAPFGARVTGLGSFPMAVYVFPIDPDLPTLIRACDQTEMLAVLRGARQDLLGEPLMLDACRVEPARYPRRRRCVLRYDLEGRRGTSEEPARRSVFGKLGADHPGQASALLEALGERAGAAPHPFRVPRLIAARPELRLDVLEKIPGAPLIWPLIRSRVLGTPAESAPIALEEAIEACAGILSVLHGWRIEVVCSRTLEGDLSTLRAELENVQRASPNLGAQLDEWIRQIADQAARLAPFPPKLSHGDYTHDQILFDDGAVGLLDFDGMCLAEPPLDLGQFCAYLRMACAKAERAAHTGATGLGDELSDRFVRTYIQAAEVRGPEVPRLRGRIGTYEALRLVRICVHSWQQLKADRLSTAVSVLEGEIGWLSTRVR